MGRKTEEGAVGAWGRRGNLNFFLSFFFSEQFLPSLFFILSFFHFFDPIFLLLSFFSEIFSLNLFFEFFFLVILFFLIFFFFSRIKQNRIKNRKKIGDENGGFEL